MLVVFNILFKVFVPLVFLVWSFFNFTVAAYSYLGLVVLFASYVILMDNNRPNPDPNQWDEFEIHVIRRYHVSLKYPNVARDCSCHILGVSQMAWLWGPWMLFNSMWIGVPVLVLFHYWVVPKAVMLDPGFHLPQAIQQGCVGADDELATLIEIRQRMYGPWV